MTPELLHLMVSHYSEKVRWALDYKQIPHRRRALLPGLHARPARRLTGRTVLPILVLDGRPIDDSTRIIEALERHYPQHPLYPHGAAERKRALELEEFCDEELGPHIRRVFLFLALPHKDYFHALNDVKVSPVTKALYRLLLPLRRGEFVARMRLHPEGVAESREKLRAAVARLERELQPSGFLVGERFSVADLTAAAMLYLLADPPEYQYRPRVARPLALVQELQAFAGSPALQWVQRMYRQYRGRSMEIHGEATRPLRAPAVSH